MKVTSELSDLVVMQSKHIMFFLYSIKILATGLPFAKTLIEYNNSLEKTEDEEKRPTDIEFT